MAIVDFNKIAKSVTSKADMGKMSGTAFDLLDPANARRAISGLLPGGGNALSKNVPNIGFSDGPSAATATAAGEDDWRVRLSLADNAQIFYKDPSAGYNSIMAPLVETNGVIWPYVPTINLSHTANYTSQQLTHSNYAQQFYNSSEVSEISINGDFTVQSAEEGQYLMAVIYFLRSATKMFFGSSNNAGNPPPILFLDGYGSHYFPHVPCVVTGFTHTMNPEVDYVQVPISKTTLEEVAQQPVDASIGSVQLSDEEQKYVPSLLRSNKATSTTMQYKTITTTTRVPTASTISVNLRPIYSRKNIHDRFNLEDFAQGKLIADKNRGLGGFL
jgi:hypothetical protein